VLNLLISQHHVVLATDRAARSSIIAPVQCSSTAKLKALTKQTREGLKEHSFQTLRGVTLRLR